ncbi:MAG: ATPase [bacterium]|nr:ATPase [bacterium]
MRKIAVPLSENAFCSHFGGADAFALYDVDEVARSIDSKQIAAPPEHGRGVFPVWLQQQGAKTILAGGMGGRAIDLFTRFGIEAIVGVEGTNPDELIAQYLAGELRTSGEVCHEHSHHNCGHEH